MTEESFSLEGRILCSDGACIGVVGPDGRCKVCGTPYEGDESIPNPIPGVAQGAEAQQNDADQHPLDTTEEERDTADDGSEDSIDPSERICCPDDMCTGIIDKNGKCGICGKIA